MLEMAINNVKVGSEKKVQIIGNFGQKYEKNAYLLWEINEKIY